MESNIFSEASLINLQIKCWGNTKKISQKDLVKISNKKLSKWINLNKGLIDKKALTDIHYSINKARMVIKDKSLPFPVEGIYIIPKNLIVKVDEELQEIIEKFKENVENFVEKYEEYVEAAREELGEELFNVEDYPFNIDKKFKMEYKFITLGVSEQINEISPELYRQEQEKFKKEMEQVRNECVLYLRKGFLEVVQDLSNMLNGFENGERKRLRQETIDKVEEFFEIFQNKNIFKDNELHEIIKKARNELIGINFENIKTSQTLQNQLTENIKEIESTLKKSIFSYKRTLKFKNK